MELTGESVLKMHKLSRRPENEEETLIGREDIGYFIVVPAVAIQIIELLERGLPFGEVERTIVGQYDEPVDVADFVQDLIAEYQFVYAVDGIVVNEPQTAKVTFPLLFARASNVVFHPLAAVPYVVMVALALLVLVRHREYMPRFEGMFVSDMPSVSLLAVLCASALITFLHELAHLLAARSLGIVATIGLSHRLVFPVAETDMSNIVLLPRHRRYKAYLAGMLWDSLLFSCGVLFLYLHDVASFALPAAVLDWVMLCNVLLLYALAFQFMFFINTDLYYVLTTYFHCYHLLYNTRLYLRRLYRTLSTRELADWEAASDREKKLVRWYAWFYAAGIVWAVSFFVLYTLRQAEWLANIIASKMTNPGGIADVADGVLSIALILLPFALLVRSWLRSRKQLTKMGR